MGEKLINPIYNVYKKYRQMNLVNPYLFKATWNLINLVVKAGLEITAGTESQRKSGIFFKPDGTRVYTCADNNELSQGDLSIPWDISTRTLNYINKSQTGSQQGLTLKNDGTKLYLVNITSNLIQAFNLTTAWDVSVKTTAETTSIPANGRGIEFNSNGTLLFIMTATTMYSYSLSTAWDVSTKTLITSKDLSADSTTFQDIRISPDGINFYLPSAIQVIKQYKASTPWDVSTLTLFRTENRSQFGAILGLWFRNDGKKLYTVANSPLVRFVEWNWK
jgi:hypothetical protein